MLNVCTGMRAGLFPEKELGKAQTSPRGAKVTLGLVGGSEGVYVYLRTE
jgi:hypothetical protein